MQIKAGPIDVSNRSTLIRQIQEAAKPKIVQFARDLAENGERLATQAANDLYDTNRPANRRRDPGSNRLGSGVMFQGLVTETADGATVTFQVLGGGVKFNALNYGSVEHEITPRNKKALAWPGIGPSLPSSRSFGSVALTGGRRSAPSHGGGSAFGIVRKSVVHPGTTGSGFWEKAIAQARRITRVR